MITLDRTPERNNSRWIAANNPIPFRFIRKDAAIVSVKPFTGTGTGTLEIELDDDYTELVAGEYVYINSTHYDGNYLIEEVIANIIIVSGKSGMATDEEGYCNFIDARENYYIQIDLQNDLGDSLIMDYISYHPSPKGIINADFSLFLKSFLSRTDNYEYGNINDIATDLVLEFNFIVREFWEEALYSAWSDKLINNFIAVNACMQIGDATGQNMSPYVMFPNTELLTPLEVLIDDDGAYITDEDGSLIQLNESYTKGKFLTMFERPVYFHGYPFSLSFLFDHSLAEYTNYVCRGEKQMDLNGVVLVSSKDRISEYFNNLNYLKVANNYLLNIDRVNVFLVNSEILPFYEYDNFRYDNVLFTNVGTEKLYNYNNVLKKTAYNFNRWDGSVLATTVYTVLTFLDPNTRTDTYVKTEKYNSAGVLTQTFGPHVIRTSTTVAGENVDAYYVSGSCDIQNISTHIYSVILSVAGVPVKYYGVITAVGATQFGTNGNRLAIEQHNHIRLSKTINSGSFALYPYPGGTGSDIIIEVSNYYTPTMAGITSENKINIIHQAGGGLVLDYNLSTAVEDEILSVFPMVEFLAGGSDTKHTYIGCGKNGRIVRMVTPDDKVSTFLTILDPIKYAIEALTDVSHGLTTEHLRRVWFISETEGYIFGDNFTVLKTIDAGVTWELIATDAVAGYSTVCYDGMVTKDGTEETFYFKCLNSITNQYDILEFKGVGQFKNGEICSEEKEIKVDNECRSNPVYLRWLNPLGGYDYWLFDKSQKVTYNVNDEMLFNKVITELTEARSRVEVLSKKATDELDVVAQNISINEINGLKYILSSPKVELYNGDVTLWIEVRIDTGTYLIYETGENKASLTFTIIKPEKYLHI